MTTGILVVLILGTVMAVIGFWSSKRNKSTDDYYVCLLYTSRCV